MNTIVNSDLSKNNNKTNSNRKNNIAILITMKNIMITTLLSLGVIAAQRLDYFWLENSLGEKSITELSQAFFLLFTALCFYKLHRIKQFSGAAMLVSGFFTVLLIREFDAYFDLIFHGFWIYPALIITFGAIVYALREGQLTNKMSMLLDDRNMQAMITFVVLLFVFSRLYGMGDFWEAVMGNHYVRDVKNISEETMELLFYAFIAFYANKTRLSVTRK